MSARRSLTCSLWLLLVAGASTGVARAQHPAAASRISVQLDTGWSYLERGDREPGALDAVPSRSWQPVTLPHTWNALDATDLVPGYRRGASWYRCALDLRRFSREARVVLVFDGANTVADLYVNGRRAGGHVGGYVGWKVDITPYVRRDAANDVRIRVDNSDDPELIPSDRSDFVIYGGLTHDVWLDVLPPAYIDHVQLRTPVVSRDSAGVTTRIAIADPARMGGAAAIEALLYDPAGRIVARASTTHLLRGPADTVALALPSIHAPRLWSPERPTLYRLHLTLARGRETDAIDERVGFRWYEFRAGGPFYLNGERLLLRGTQRHEEYAGVGGAVPDSLDVRDLQMMKAMGANFVRLAHYPQAPAVYRAADSLGVLVWDELPWDRGGVGDGTWRANTERLLREQIDQNENHPSVILWSLGNEVADVIEPGKAGDSAPLRGFMGRLDSIAHQIDPSRPTATRKFEAGADLVDVYSPSIWAGWYGGVYASYEHALVAARARYPHFVHMEYGADAHYGRHTETPITGAGLQLDSSVAEAVGKPVANIARDGDWSESYQTDLLDWHLMVSERLDWFTGSAQWVFRDFATPLRPENPIPYVNEKGLLTRDGRPKDAYYVYRAYWTTAPRFAYIVSHSWTVRSGPRGAPRSVRVYSNCANVELLVNGVGKGTRQRAPGDFPAQGLRWTVPFEQGRNVLVARCTGSGDGGAADSLQLRYTSDTAGHATDVHLDATRLPNGNVLVEALLVDARGRRVLRARDRVYFDLTGAGRLLADRGTPTGSRVIEAANGRAAIEVAPPPPGGRAVVIARTQALNGGRLIIEGP